MHLGHEIAIAQHEADSARTVAAEAWAALSAAHEGRPHLAALRSAYLAIPHASPEAQPAFAVWQRAMLVELFDAYSARVVADEVARLAQQRLAALRAIAASDTYECAAGAGVAQ